MHLAVLTPHTPEHIGEVRKRLWTSPRVENLTVEEIMSIGEVKIAFANCTFSSNDISAGSSS